MLVRDSFLARGNPRSSLPRLAPLSHLPGPLPPLPWGTARQKPGCCQWRGDFPSPCVLHAGVVLGRAQGKSDASCVNAWDDCVMEDGIPPAFCGGGWYPGWQPYNWWQRRSSLAGLVVSLSLVVKAFAGGGAMEALGFVGQMSHTNYTRQGKP
jgi:hypothetical protein